MSTEKGDFKIADKIKEFLDSSKSKTIIIVCGIIGILLIFLSSFFEFDNSNQTVTDTEKNIISETEFIATYKEDTETNLGNMIASIEGAGTTKIMVTVDSSIEYVYATDDKGSDNSVSNNASGESADESSISREETNVILRLSNGEEQLVTVTEIQPKIRGVLVICEGGDDIEVEQRVLEAVTKALDISTNKVCVTKLSK